jgi:hypothetical protein
MADEERDYNETDQQPQRDPAARRRRNERQLQSEASDRPLREPDFDPTSRGDESGEVL